MCVVCIYVQSCLSINCRGWRIGFQSGRFTIVIFSILIMINICWNLFFSSSLDMPVTLHHKKSNNQCSTCQSCSLRVHQNTYVLLFGFNRPASYNMKCDVECLCRPFGRILFGRTSPTHCNMTYQPISFFIQFFFRSKI